MRKLTIISVLCFAFLWGSYFYLKDKHQTNQKQALRPLQTREKDQARNVASTQADSTLLAQDSLRDLNRIGEVINEENVEIDEETKEKILKEKVQFDNKKNIQEKVALLEQSFLDRSSTVKDIKRLQGEIIELKNKMKMDVSNTEKWDPNFVYYLMISENYTYHEVNQIRSLSENGITTDELNYINKLIKDKSFSEKVSGFKQQGEISRAVATFRKPKIKEKDDFIDVDSDDEPQLEEKLIEMNYNQQEKQEMIYGHSVQ